MSKMKRALRYKDKFLLDDHTVFHVADVRLERRNKWAPRLYITFIMQDMRDGSEFWHVYEDKKRSQYVVVASLSGTRLGNGEPE